LRLGFVEKIGDDDMQCRTHPTRSAANTCSHCASWLCDDCVADVQGKIFCRPCLAVLSQAPTPESHTPPPHYTSATHNKVNLGLLLFFSFFPPGANYMFMGLMRRGLATMAGFFLLIFLIAGSSMPLTLILVFSLVVLTIASFLDGFNVRRRINAGEAVRDDVGDILNGIISNKFLRTIILVVVAIVLIINILGFAFSVIGTLLPWLVVGLIVYLIIKRKPHVK